MYSFSGNYASSVTISPFMCLWVIYMFLGSVHWHWDSDRTIFVLNIMSLQCRILLYTIGFFIFSLQRKYPLLYMFIHVIFPVYNELIIVMSLNYSVFVYFCGWLECWPHLWLCRPFCIFERCLDSNTESCRSKQVRYHLSHPSYVSSQCASQCMLKIHVSKQNVFTTYDLYVSLYVIPCPSYCCCYCSSFPPTHSPGPEYGNKTRNVYGYYTVYGIAHWAPILNPMAPSKASLFLT